MQSFIITNFTKMQGANKSRKIAKVTLWIAIPLLILSIGMFFIFNLIYNNKLKNDITLAKDSLVTREVWKDIPLPIYEKIYFFNITNVDSFLDGDLLNVTEVGPYTYESKWTKPNPVWNPNKTVSYREVRTYHFVPELSNGTEDDLIYSLNAPLIIASNLVRNYNFIIRDGMYLFFLANSETLVTRKSIRQLVYEGYYDIIIADAPYIKKDIPYKDGRFSWLYGKNATDDGLFTVFTGEDDASKTNYINNWNGNENLTFWKGDSCNKIDATSIETGPPIDGNIDSYSFFQSIFCRTLTFKSAGDTEHFDISAKRFKPTSDLYANSTENPENSCFEVNKQHASGIMDISPCQFGAPVFISNPHFHLADKSYLNLVNGLNPSEQEHGSYLDIEPLTGVTIDITMRFQINVEVNKVDNILQFHKSNNGIYPVFWVELSLKIDEHMANFLKSNLRLPKVIAYSVLITVAGICIILIFVSLIVLALTPKRDNSASASLIKQEESSKASQDDFPRTKEAADNVYISDGFRATDYTTGSAGLTKDSFESNKRSPPKSPVQLYPSL